MLSQRIIQHTRHHLTRSVKPASVSVFRQLHSLHEDSASVLPNNIETASASFKVGFFFYLKKGPVELILLFRKMQRKCKN